MIGLSPGLVGGTGHSLLEFQFYGLAAEISLQFTNGPVILRWSMAPVGAATPDRMEHMGFQSRTGRKEVPMADPPDDFRRRDWDS
jgi:hypothetical protein